MRSRIRHRLMLIVASSALSASVAQAVNWRYDYGFDPAQPATDASRRWDIPTGGWWFNFGPTGIRVKFNEDKPRQAEVTYVFKDSPADGKILPGDQIVGVNGKRFSSDAVFVPGRGETWSLHIQGPQKEVALAIEESEGNTKLNGMIAFSVTRKDVTTEVKLQLEPLGYFSSTFPYNCKKSELLAKKAADWLDEYSSDPIGWGGMFHSDSGPILAFMSFGKNSKYMPRVEKWAQAQYNKEWRPLWSWIVGMYGITLGEYYLMTGDKKILPAIELNAKTSADKQGPAGQYSHKDFVPDGFKLAFPTGLNGLSMALAKRCGVKIDEGAYLRTRYLLSWSTNDKGGIGYGAHNDVPITESEARDKCSHINIKAPKYNEDESGNGVGRLVGGAMTTTLMHMVDSMDSYSEDFVKRGVRNACCARWSSRQAHSCGSLSFQWCLTALSLAPLTGEDEYFREAMDDLKLWLNIARCYDGSYYFEPKIDTEGDPFSRLMVTAGAILILNSPQRNLYILGKGYGNASAASTAQGSPMASKPAPVVKEPVREARPLSPESRFVLDKALKSTLVKLSETNLIKPMPMRLTFTSAKIALVSASADEVVFKADNGTQGSLSWDKLAPIDMATLAVLASTIKPDSGDAKALVGVYMESLGRVEEADKYFESAGESSRKKLEKLFN